MRALVLCLHLWLMKIPKGASVRLSVALRAVGSLGDFRCSDDPWVFAGSKKGNPSGDYRHGCSKALPNEPWLAISVGDEVDIVFIAFSVQSYIAIERHGIYDNAQTA